MKTLKISTLIPFLFLSLYLTGQNKYVNTKFGYELEFPSEWKEEKSKGAKYTICKTGNLEYTSSYAKIKLTPVINAAAKNYKNATNKTYQIENFKISVFSGEMVSFNGPAKGYAYYIQKDGTNKLYSVSLVNYGDDMPDQESTENFFSSFKTNDGFQMEFENESSITGAKLLSKEVVFEFKPFKINPFIGMSLTWLGGFKDAYGEDYNQHSTSLSFQVGLNGTYAFNKNIGIETGLSYLWNAGTSYTYYAESTSVKTSIDLNYVAIPVLFKFDFLGGLNVTDANSAGIRAGLEYGINTKAEETTEIEYNRETTITTNNISSITNNNTSLCLGLYTSTSSFGIGLDYNLGLNEVFQEGKTKLNQVKMRIFLKF